MSTTDLRRPLFSLPLVAALIVLAGGLVDRTLYFDGDPYWHVAVGQWIAANHAVPVQDAYSFTHPGLAWTAHEWLSELVMFGAYRFGGWPAIQVLTAGAFALTAGYMLRFLLDRMSLAMAVTSCVVCVSLMSMHYYGRPHVLVWPITALWVGTLTAAGEDRRPPPWWLLMLFVVWANLHASFTLGLGFAGALALDACWSADAGAQRMTLVRRWSVFLLAAGACAIVNPRGIDALTHATGVMRMKATLDIVAEWKSADFHQFQFLTVWLALVMTAAFTGRLRLSPIRIVFVLGLLYLALKHQRYHALVGLVSPFLLARPLGEGMRRAAGDAIDAMAPRFTPTAALAARASRAGIVLAALAAVGIVAACRPLIPAGPTVFFTPSAALAAFDATGIKANVFNSYGFGGYLIFRQVPVFVDGRGDMYGDTFMSEIDDAGLSKKPHALDSLLTKYHIGWTLLRPNTAAVELLDHLPAWQKLYADSVAVVHVRRDLMAASRPAPRASAADGPGFSPQRAPPRR